MQWAVECVDATGSWRVSGWKKTTLWRGRRRRRGRHCDSSAHSGAAWRQRTKIVFRRIINGRLRRTTGAAIVSGGIRALNSHLVCVTQCNGCR